MKKAAMLFIIIAVCLLMPLTAAAAPAQKYSLMAGGSKITAYLIEDEIYVRPQELAKAYSGTALAFDTEIEDGVLAVTLKKDCTDDVPKFKCKGSYDDVAVGPMDFRVSGIDAVGSVTSAVIEEQSLVRLKDLAGIVGFSYIRNKETGSVRIEKDRSLGFGTGTAGLSSDRYIDMVADLVYGSLITNDSVRVLSKSADIAKLLAPDDYGVEGVKISQGSPLAAVMAGGISAKLQESDTRDIDPDKPMVAITFDDGPREGNTERILEALDAVDGRATFFMVGTNVENYPDTVLAVAEQGSELANHSYNHPQLTTLGTSAALEQINKTNGLINNVTGITPTIGRPPYGSIDADIINGSGMEWFNWSLDTLDWKYRNADTVYDTVISTVSDRDVILMHDIHESTVDAAVRIIPKLNEMGYQLVTISELCEVMDGAENVSGHISR